MTKSMIWTLLDLWQAWCLFQCITVFYKLSSQHTGHFKLKTLFLIFKEDLLNHIGSDQNPKDHRLCLLFWSIPHEGRKEYSFECPHRMVMGWFWNYKLCSMLKLPKKWIGLYTQTFSSEKFDNFTEMCVAEKNTQNTSSLDLPRSYCNEWKSCNCRNIALRSGHVEKIMCWHRDANYQVLLKKIGVWNLFHFVGRKQCFIKVRKPHYYLILKRWSLVFDCSCLCPNNLVEAARLKWSFKMKVMVKGHKISVISVCSPDTFKHSGKTHHHPEKKGQSPVMSCSCSPHLLEDLHRNAFTAKTMAWDASVLPPSPF